MIGIVGGSSLLGSDMFASLAPQHVATSHGPVVVHIGTNIAFVQRHKTKVDQHYELPHDVRHAAIAEAFCVLGVTVVFGVCSVGSLTARVPPGSVCVCDDYFNIWGVRSGLRDERAHIAPGYDKEMREVIVRVVSEAGLVAHPGTYVQTTGPRFETKAEVRFLASVGDVVGMTVRLFLFFFLYFSSCFSFGIVRERTRPLTCRSVECATLFCAWPTTGPTV
jgi:purine nucleoside phosphorylase